MALSIGNFSRIILKGTHTVPLQHSQPIHGYPSASSWEMVRLSAIRACDLGNIVYYLPVMRGLLTQSIRLTPVPRYQTELA
jgi:hypothetical protein